MVGTVCCEDQRTGVDNSHDMFLKIQFLLNHEITDVAALVYSCLFVMIGSQLDTSAKDKINE